MSQIQDSAWGRITAAKDLEQELVAAEVAETQVSAVESEVASELPGKLQIQLGATWAEASTLRVI